MYVGLIIVQVKVKFYACGLEKKENHRKWGIYKTEI